MAAQNELHHAAPGDITISTFPGGYLIGRMLDPFSSGSEWEFVTAVRDGHWARQLGCGLAAGQHAVWILETQEGESVRIDCAQLTDEPPQ